MDPMAVEGGRCVGKRERRRVEKGRGLTVSVRRCVLLNDVEDCGCRGDIRTISVRNEFERERRELTHSQHLEKSDD